VFKDAAANGNVDLLARTLTYSPETKLLAVAEQNVLGDPTQPNVGSNQVINVMADAAYRVTGKRPVDPDFSNRGRNVQQYELRVQRMDERFDAKLKELFEKSTGEGKWKGTHAIHSRADYWCAGVLAYFDATGQEPAPEGADFPINTRESLREYDRGLYDLVHETMAYAGRVGWRFQPATPK
jgi:hypothetical protein